jgi:GT2 family glycosyltransferase
MKPYLKKFLEALPNQTMFDQIEVILDHNEPDEEEVAWVKEFQQKYPNRIKHIIVNPVEVIGASMNRCIAEAVGKYVTIWNVDDLRTANSIESQVKAIEEKHADIAIGDYKIVRRFGEKEIGNIVEHRGVPESEFKRSMYFGPFVMFKKSLCEKAGYFDEQLTSGADFDLSIRLAYNGKVAIADDLLGYYLNEGKGASTRPDSKQALDKAIILLRYGIFDKVDLSFIPKLVAYSIPDIISFKGRDNVSKFVPDYKNIILNNTPHFKKSLYASAVSVLFRYKEVKLVLKSKIKKIIYANK